MSDATTDVAALADKMPDPGGGTLTGPEWDHAAAACEEVLKGAPASVAKLAGMLHEHKPGEEIKDFKPRYLLHVLAVHVCRTGDDAKRRQYAEALASTLADDRPNEPRGYLVRQVQACGGPEVAPALGKLLADDDLCDSAAMALQAVGGDAAANELRAALPGATGRRRMAIAQALGALRDARATDALKQAAGDADPQVKLVALWALANAGDPAAAETLTAAADAMSGFDRVRATDACLLLAENLLAAGRKGEAANVYAHLRDTRTGDAERQTRDAAERGLKAAG